MLCGIEGARLLKYSCAHAFSGTNAQNSADPFAPMIERRICCPALAKIVELS
jgi:hypothetical protein